MFPILHQLTMGRAFFIVFFLLVQGASFGQTYWAKTQAGGNVDETLGVTGDASGNSYTTGYFSTTATINGSTENVNGLTDIFITKINSTGGSVWVVSAGGSASDRGLGIAVDGSGNVIVCGFFSGSIDFGNGVSISSNSGSQDSFVAKYDGNGNPLWARAGGSSANSDRANAVAVDNAGNVIITGQYSGEATFGSLSLTSLNSSIDIFIVKYDASGTELWAKSGSGSATDRGLSITTDNSNNVYTTGQFSGDITFDNSYSNTIQNALFLIKYSASGTEEWFRWAGGSDQSIANGITSDGTNVYLTGDFGGTLSFLGSGISTLTSGYSNAVFIASYSGAGALLWKENQGSTSTVSAKAIAYADGELGVAGWYNCTFESLRDEYGESAFNSIGYKDAYVMRYASSGSFIYARNFGSQSDEICTGIHILPDGHEVVTGAFRDTLNIPVSLPIPTGLSQVANAPNAGVTYCGDPDYGVYGELNSIGNDQDGFTIKTIDPDRAPYDYYERLGSGCDLDIPDLCISQSYAFENFDCPDTIIGCSSYNVFANNYIVYNTDLGYHANYSWNPPSLSSYYQVVSPHDLSVTVTSADGCYTHEASAYVDVYESPETPLLSDNLGVNTLDSIPETIYLCPGETVDIWADFPDGYTFTWSGAGVGADQVNADTVTISQTSACHITVENEFGCTRSVSVLVVVYQAPPELLDPYIFIPNLSGDTLTKCGSLQFPVFVLDHITESQIQSQFYDFNWSISPSGSIFNGGSSTTAQVSQSGWYTITVNFETKDHPCEFEINTYSATDSIYVAIYPIPQPTVALTGPAFACPGDTMTLLLSWNADSISLPSTVVTDFGDSLYVISPGQFDVSVFSTNEFGCQGSASASWTIASVNTPSIVSNPTEPVICPGDSVQLISASEGGSIIWQGPDGSITNDTSIYVLEAGAYYTEVTYYEGCALVSNTIDVVEYSTPYIAGNDGIMCPGVPLEISIISPTITDITWLAPLSGNDTTQIITSPGIYTAQVTSCGIVSEVSIEIEADTNTVSIVQPDLAPVCAGDSIFIQAVPAIYPTYNWNPQGSGSEEYFTQAGSIQTTAIDSFGCELISNTLTLDFELVPPGPDFDFSLVCEGETQVVTVNSQFGVTYLAAPGGAIVQQTPTFSISNFLTDTTLYVFLSTEFCDGPLDSLVLSPKPFPDDPILGTDAPACTGTAVNLVVLNPTDGASYHWVSPSGNGFTGVDVNYSVPDMSEAGIYTCYANLSECLSDTTAIPIELFETQQVVLPPDTGMCYRGDYLVLPNMQFQDYLWQDGSTDSTYSASQTTEIFLVVHDFNGCQSFDAMNVELVDCTPIIPNVFTPNGDGKNDTWFVSLDQPLYAQIIVFNRWGRKVFESNDLSQSWDGLNYTNGKECAEGVYFYIVRLLDFEGTSIEDHGPLTLIRE